MTSLKIALIDDEIHALKHIGKLIASVSGKYEIVASYTNAQTALQELLLIDVDLIFVDIMMPIIDGLNFAQQYLKKKPYTQIIVLTSYQDFEFAKKSVEIGICDYWIKNELRASTIGEKLKNAEESVERAHLIEESMEIQKLSLVVKKEKPLSSIFGEEKVHCRYFFIAFQNPNNLETLTEVKIKLKQILLDSSIKRSTIVPNLYIHYCLCEISCEKSSQLSRMWELFKSEVLREFNGKNLPCIILGNYFKKDELCTAQFENFINAIKNFHPEPEQTCHIISNKQVLDYRTDSELYKHFNDEYFIPFLKIIETCEINDAMTEIYRIWNDHYNKIGNDASILFCIKRLWEIARTLKTTPLVESNFSAILEGYKQCSLNEIQTQTMEAYSVLFSSWKAKIQSPSQRISAITRYIQTNYQSDLKLSSLVDEFGLSADYLRKLFKRETGISVTDYITKVRMTAAQDLLKTGKYKIYEISELVGYNSSAYFSQAFFKCNGYYPTENTK